jgi:hypothetical protein
MNSANADATDEKEESVQFYIYPEAFSLWTAYLMVQ